jgi:SLT domain-containing protein
LDTTLHYNYTKQLLEWSLQTRNRENNREGNTNHANKTGGIQNDKHWRKSADHDEPTYPRRQLTRRYYSTQEHEKTCKPNDWHSQRSRVYSGRGQTTYSELQTPESARTERSHRGNPNCYFSKHTPNFNRNV